MGTENMAENGPFERARRFIRGVSLILIGYVTSIIFLMALRGTVLAGLSDGAWYPFFGAWVLGTLAVLGLLFGN